MQLDNALEKITKYLKSANPQPIIVDIQNSDAFEALKAQFPGSFYDYIDAGSYCRNDAFLPLDELKNSLTQFDKKVFVTGISSFLKLKGTDYLRSNLKRFLDLTLQASARVVIITYQCHEHLDYGDRRLYDANRIIIIDGESDHIPLLTFVSPEISVTKEQKYKGINTLAKAVEFNPCEQVFVSTKSTATDFPQSLLQISMFSSAYNIIRMSDNKITSIKENFGTAENWALLLRHIDKTGDLEGVIKQEFGGISNLPYLINSYSSFDDFKKWLYVLLLKIYNENNRQEYLSEVMQRVETYHDFLTKLFQTILEFDPANQKFDRLYAERKLILKNFGNATEDVCEFCKLVQSKGENALSFLTDNTDIEKQTIIRLLGRYAQELEKTDITSKLKIIYPDLYEYMSEYKFENTLLRSYFQSYKHQKVFNYISPDFMKIVDEQAEKREYNTILRPRVSYLESIDTHNANVYFIDALGVEYLSFILAHCNYNNLFANVTICRAELPSITCMNKEFVDVFKAAGCNIMDIKELDDLKHHGTNDFDYRMTKEPIYLIEELKIISQILEKIRICIASGQCEKAIIISDHGASRLAVISEIENKYEMSVKGEHSGRCCPVSDLDEKPMFATEENGYWVLANYERFKGSRKANVEVHGGATLEEICIPIIEISAQNEKIEVRLLENYKNITVSYRKPALIKFYVSKKMSNLKIKIDNSYYEAQPTAEEFVYQVNMPTIHKTKDYIFDVYASDNLISSGLSFKVKSEGAIEKDLF